MVAPGCADAAAAGAAAAAAGVPHKGELLLTGKLRLHLPMPRLLRGTEIDLTLFYFILHDQHCKPPTLDYKPLLNTDHI